MANISLLKLEDGRVKTLDVGGNYIKTIGKSGVTDARIQDYSIIISNKTGKTKIYDLREHYEETL